MEISTKGLYLIEQTFLKNTALISENCVAQKTKHHLDCTQVQVDILIVRITESLPTVKASKTMNNEQAINTSQNLTEHRDSVSLEAQEFQNNKILSI